MLQKAYEEAKAILAENREIMDQIAAYLIEKETITGKEFMEIYRRAKGIPEPEETEAAEEAKPETSGEMKAEAEPEQPGNTPQEGPEEEPGEFREV